MPMFLQQIISESLQEPPRAIAYEASRRLAESFPGRAIVEGDDCDFDLPRFAQAGRCRVRREEAVHAQVATLWNRDRGAYESPRNAWYEVEWEGHDLDVILMTTDSDCLPYYWILADDEAVAESFFAAVCSFDPEVQDELLVFDAGRWDRSLGLFEAIRGNSLDDLILGGTLKDDLRSDLDRFFAGRDLYGRLGVPWKRGLLLTGPPGNGKTHAIKGLIQALGKPCLYVKSFDSERWTHQTAIGRVFARARRLAPCMLVFEDLDSLVTDENRSFFLNELDGFAANAGIAVVATTNHPEKLDPALVERPSRFDRKYHFGLPARPDRLAYVERWRAGLPDGLVLSDDACRLVADRTEGFSFAYLKELFLSSVLALAADGRALPLDGVILDQVDALGSQMGARKDA